jgi:hypothetical protein
MIPIMGQMILAFTLFQKCPGKVLTYIGLAGIGVLMLLVLVTGLLGGGFKTVISTMPFLLTSVLVILHIRRYGKKQ